MNEFSRVGGETANQICENASLLPATKPADMSREMVEKLMEGIEKTKIMSPPTTCISPIGEELLEKGLRKEINAEFYCVTTRPPAVYRGNPFIVEAGIAYGGEQPGDQPANLMRFANRVPLLYQQSACAVFKSVAATNWKSYGMQQSNGSPPVGPISICVHIASVWVPFTSESKEAVAHYSEIIKEVKLALQEVGRKLSIYIHKKKNIQFESKKRGYIETYIPHVADALKELIALRDDQAKEVENHLKLILEKTRGKLETVETQNPDFDEEFAAIGKEDDDSGEQDE
jgi:DNA topoisomerase-6 subunit B